MHRHARLCLLMPWQKSCAPADRHEVLKKQLTNFQRVSQPLQAADQCDISTTVSLFFLTTTVSSPNQFHFVPSSVITYLTMKDPIEVQTAPTSAGTVGIPMFHEGKTGKTSSTL